MIHDVTSERNHKLRRLSSPFNGPNKLWQEPIVANEKIIALGALCVCSRPCQCVLSRKTHPQ